MALWQWSQEQLLTDFTASSYTSKTLALRVSSIPGKCLIWLNLVITLAVVGDISRVQMHLSRLIGQAALSHTPLFKTVSQPFLYQQLANLVSYSGGELVQQVSQYRNRRKAPALWSRQGMLSYCQSYEFPLWSTTALHYFIVRHPSEGLISNIPGPGGWAPLS